MRYTLDLAYLAVILLAGLPVVFMLWVFWNFSREIRSQVRSKMPPALALAPDRLSRDQWIAKKHDGAGSPSASPEAEEPQGSMRQRTVEMHPRGFASRIQH